MLFMPELAECNTAQHHENNKCASSLLMYSLSKHGITVGLHVFIALLM
jgi:hypothetical protein